MTYKNLTKQNKLLDPTLKEKLTSFQDLHWVESPYLVNSNYTNEIDTTFVQTTLRKLCIYVVSLRRSKSTLSFNIEC